MGAAAGGIVLLSSPTHGVSLPSLCSPSLGTSLSAAARGGEMRSKMWQSCAYSFPSSCASGGVGVAFAPASE